ncbi:hypothetical protein [Achromobacter sp.]|uniref:hypothetical protein n=1 Tax=Achromobacter sp. TaxID=134375 RepID=UPI0028AB8F66|nr:hypothetical protein [Achromobacter sp.]
MQRASGLGRAWIIAPETAIPIDENSRFLALLIPYVDDKAQSGVASVDRRGGIARNVGFFGGSYRLWTGLIGVTLRVHFGVIPHQQGIR